MSKLLLETGDSVLLESGDFLLLDEPPFTINVFDSVAVSENLQITENPVIRYITVSDDVFVSEATAFAAPPAMPNIVRKQIFAKVSTSLGQFIATWSKFGFNGYTKELNSGPAECLLTLDVAFDYEGGDLTEGNDVEVVISDQSTVADDNVNAFEGARTIYRGYISLVERSIDGAKEQINVHLLGYYTLLAVDVLKNGVQTTMYTNNVSGLTTVSADWTPADIGLIARTVIDRYNIENPGSRIFYLENDIPDMGVNAKYQFQQKTYREALDILKQLAPPDVYWYVSETGRIKFQAKPGASTHVFVFGRDFSKILVQKSLEKLRNSLLLWNGKTGVDSIYKTYADASSMSLYGRRTERVNDYGIGYTDAADAEGDKFLSQNKDIAIKVVATILDNGSQDLSGTTDITRVGSEMVVNGKFTGSATGWFVNGRWAYNSNNVKYTP